MKKLSLESYTGTSTLNPSSLTLALQKATLIVKMGQGILGDAVETKWNE
jgi:hypothetical protein